ncbi:hypothetical protein Tco_1248836 [Tanacetum coccineum]
MTMSILSQDKPLTIGCDKTRDINTEENLGIIRVPSALYDNESWNDPRDFAKPVKAIALPQDVPSTSDRRLIELENQWVSGPHDTQYCMEDPEQAFVEYASSCTNEAGGKWYTFKLEQNNLGDTLNPSWKSHPNLGWRQPQNSQNNFSNPPNRFQSNGSILNHSFNNNPRRFNSQSNLEGLVSNFMASQDARLSKFEADFKQQQSEMTNKINTVLKAITDRIVGMLPSDMVKNPKLGTHPVLSARSYPTMDPQCSTQIHSSINTITIYPKQQSDPHDRTKGNKEEERGSPKNHPDSPTPPDPSDDNSHKEEPEAGVQEVEYLDIFPTRIELAYHKYLMCGLIPSIFLRNPIIMEGCPLNLKIPCNIGHVILGFYKECLELGPEYVTGMDDEGEVT